MEHNFAHECSCCGKTLDGKPHFLDRISEKKLCLPCSEVSVSWEVNADREFILGEDIKLVANSGKSLNNHLSRIIATEQSRASYNISVKINELIKNNTHKNTINNLAQAYECLPLTATKNEMDAAVLGAEIANLEFQIDKAIDKGDRYSFLALSGQLKELLAKAGESNEAQ